MPEIFGIQYKYCTAEYKEVIFATEPNILEFIVEVEEDNDYHDVLYTALAIAMTQDVEFEFYSYLNHPDVRVVGNYTSSGLTQYSFNVKELLLLVDRDAAKAFVDYKMDKAIEYSKLFAQPKSARNV